MGGRVYPIPLPPFPAEVLSGQMAKTGQNLVKIRPKRKNEHFARVLMASAALFGSAFGLFLVFLRVFVVQAVGL